MGDMPEGKCYAWHLTDIRAIYPFPVKGKLNFFNVDDSLIQIVDDEGKTDEEIQAWYDQYFAPLLYKGRR